MIYKLFERLFNNVDFIFASEYVQIIIASLILSCFLIGGYRKYNSMEDITNLIKTKIIFPHLPRYFSQYATKITIGIEFILPIIIILSIIHRIFIRNKEKNNNFNKLEIENREKKSVISLIGKISTFIIIIFTLLISFIFHNPALENERMSFLKNMGIIGGLMAIYKYI